MGKRGADRGGRKRGSEVGGFRATCPEQLHEHPPLPTVSASPSPPNSPRPSSGPWPGRCLGKEGGGRERERERQRERERERERERTLNAEF